MDRDVEELLYGYLQDFGTHYCLIGLRPSHTNPPFIAIVLGTWNTSADCHHLHPDLNGRTIDEIRKAYPDLILCEDFQEARMTIRRLDLTD